jgi:hypothetical protein
VLYKNREDAANSNWERIERTRLAEKLRAEGKECIWNCNWERIESVRVRLVDDSAPDDSNWERIERPVVRKQNLLAIFLSLNSNWERIERSRGRLCYSCSAASTATGKELKEAAASGSALAA